MTTEETLAELRRLDARPGCHHSVGKDGCESCDERDQFAHLFWSSKDMLLELAEEAQRSRAVVAAAEELLAKPVTFRPSIDSAIVSSTRLLELRDALAARAAVDAAKGE